MKTYNEIVLHIPHSQTDGLENSGWMLSDAFMSEVNKWTDWQTDSLFQCDLPHIYKKVFPLSRFVVDVERLPDDPLEEIGQGIVYHQFELHSRQLSPSEEARLMDIYKQHINGLVSLLTPDSLLIDCHSFPSVLSDVDVCIGYNEDWSRPAQDVVNMIAEAYRNEGLKVGINTPYSNSISPDAGFPYHSVMIELNKRTYWDEAKLLPTHGAEKMHSIFTGLCERLLGK